MLLTLISKRSLIEVIVNGHSILNMDPVSVTTTAPRNLPPTVFGKSSLFDTSTGNDSSISDGVSAPDEVTQFISTRGSVVKLKLKKTSRDDTQRPSLYNEAISWKNDDSYGININALMDKIAPSLDENPEEEVQPEKRRKKEGLWVEKWRPNSFLDLVGNEKTNRRILRWLRQWSYAVFKEELPKPPTKFDNFVGEEIIDHLQRPSKRILLIHGPPGIGKTSVAHVVAKQAGYTVAEINASDERAGPIVKEKVHNTLFNHTFNGGPVCLIADEIDGSIESGFVKVLLDIIYKDARATNRQKYMSNMNGKGKSKEKKTSNILTRPIIAICNNVYAPALEKLKPHCEIVSFKRPSDAALEERLKHICKEEKIHISMKLMIDLIDLAQGDLRNCINNLQFMANTNISDSNLHNLKEDQNDMDSSSKDTTVSWFKIVNQIFRKDPHRDVRNQFFDILNMVEMNGNSDRILQGCFSLYPHVKYSDIGVNKPTEIADWLYFHDLMQKSLYEHNGELIRYSSLVPLAFFNKFGDIANKDDMRIKNSDYESRETQKINMDIIKSVLHHISVESPALAAFISRNSLVFEILPYLDYMLSSDLTKFKNNVTRSTVVSTLLGILKSFQLSLSQIETDGITLKPVLGIEPQLDKVVLLDPNRSKCVYTKRPVSLNILLAKSEEMKVKKRHFSKITKEKEVQEEISNKKSKTARPGNTISFFKNQYESIKSTQVNDSINNETENMERSDLKAGRSEHIRIWVKYKAGFSNAVRKNVTWNSMWE